MIAPGAGSLARRPGALRSSGLVLGALLALSPALPDDCDHNGLDDIEEIEAGQAADCDGNFVPDACDLLPVNPSLALWTAFTAGNDNSVPGRAVGDIDVDGDDDLVLGASAGQLHVYRSTGEGFDLTVLEEGERVSPEDLQDVDGDGDLDLLATRFGRFSIHFNSGEGDLRRTRLFLLGDGEFYGTAADMNGDGLPEAVLRAAPADGPPEIRILENLDGVFGPGEKRPVNFFVNRFVHGDLDGDNDIDLVITAGWPGAVQVLFNDGSGQLQDGQLWTDCPGTVSVADLDADGDLDMTVRRCLLMNDGKGLFALMPGPTATLVERQETGTGDFDGDGDIDIVAVDPDLHLFVNGGEGRFLQAPRMFDRDEFRVEFDLLAGDFTGDGTAELLAHSSPWVRVYTLTRTSYGADCNENAFLDSCDIARRTSSDCNSNGVPDECDPGPDCNGNGLPDECDIATTYGDCNLNGIPESCEPFLDCNSNGVRDSCDITRSSSIDCNYNFVPDECERPEGDPCRRAHPVWGCTQDCNGNLIHDACDLESGTSLDADGSGRPDECERPFLIELGFRGPSRLHETGDGTIRFDAVATLATTVQVPVPPGMGVQGWFISVAPDGCSVVSATTEGTVAAPEAGYWEQGFNKTGVDRSFRYAHSAVALTTTGAARAVLPLDGGPYDILRMTLEAQQPADGTCPPCELRYEVGFMGGQPVDIVVTVEGNSAPLVMEEATLCPGFRRGDVNTSGKVDISDPIRLFMSLFLGAETPACQDGADANDDGLVNITDGIFLLQDLFRGELGTVIPSPGPFACSPDPTEDTLDCVDPGGCS